VKEISEVRRQEGKEVCLPSHTSSTTFCKMVAEGGSSVPFLFLHLDQCFSLFKIKIPKVVEKTISKGKAVRITGLQKATFTVKF
jgi:hypothetical protein